jgi:ADP-heptose:LPS heptosyltransferase
VPDAAHALQPRSIAVFRALQLGDMLCAVPALRALRRRWPQAHITLIGLPWARDFARRFSRYLDDFIAFPGYPGFPEQEPKLDAWPAFLQAVQARRFGLAIQLHGDGSRSNGVLRLLGAEVEAGFSPEDEDGFFLRYPSVGSETQRLLQLAAFLGADTSREQLEFPLGEADFAEWRAHPEIDALLQSNQAFLCVHAGARAADKRWPPQQFARVADALSQETGWPVVLSGSAQEQALTKAVAEAMQAPVIDAALPVSVGALAALLSRSRLLVSNDTGASHLACALQVPSVVVFRNTDMDRWAPRDRTRHRAVWDPAGERVDEVLSEARSLLGPR